MEYNELKKGDVIVVKEYYDDEKIVIFDRIEKNVFGELHLYTSVEFTLSSLFLEYVEPGYFYIIGKDIVNYRFATDDEKEKIYNAMSKYESEMLDLAQSDTTMFK